MMTPTLALAVLALGAGLLGSHLVLTPDGPGNAPLDRARTLPIIALLLLLLGLDLATPNHLVVAAGAALGVTLGSLYTAFRLL